MKWFILLISLTVVQNRPQNSPQETEPNVQLEKQTIIELNPAPVEIHAESTAHPTHRKIEESTRDILEKIAEVNKKQGLTRKKERPHYFHFPFSYSRAQDEKKTVDRQSSNFKFPTNPFSNPIFEYLEREENQKQRTKFSSDVTGTAQDEAQQEFYDKSPGKEPSIGITKDDLIHNQYVKRKIVHQQTVLMPNPSMFPPNLNSMVPPNIPPYAMPSPMNLEQLIPSTPFLGSEDNQHSNKINDKNVLNNLEKQTVDNVRNIVSSTQLMQSPAFYNPYLQYLQRYAQDQLPYGPLTAYSNNVDSNYAYNQNYGLFDPLSSEKGRQNWNWPGASYFPIYIRDPFLQFYNAITSMVEYGPNAGQAGPCKRPKTGKPKGKDFTREAKTADEYDEKEQITFEIGDKNAPQITIYGFDGEADKNNSNYLDIEDIDIGANNPNTLKFTVNLRSGKTDTDNKAVKTTWDKIVESGNPSHNSSARPSSKYEKHEESKEFRPPLFFKPPTKPPATPPPQQPSTSPSSPVKGSVGVKGRPDDDDMDEDEKADDINISNDGNKKLFSRDNTGSGIFIHKLKVKKGGVAIAGPGGIATAGSGGTAIVGPNGIAYTHPDSLAIAGSGTKVVAVDPSINLAELIYNTTSNSSKPNADGFPPSRVGRVVAVGPVVYYNRG